MQVVQDQHQRDTPGGTYQELRDGIEGAEPQMIGSDRVRRWTRVAAGRENFETGNDRGDVLCLCGGQQPQLAL